MRFGVFFGFALKQKNLQIVDLQVFRAFKLLICGEGGKETHPLSALHINDLRKFSKLLP